MVFSVVLVLVARFGALKPIYMFCFYLFLALDITFLITALITYVYLYAKVKQFLKSISQARVRIYIFTRLGDSRLQKIKH